MINLHLKRTMTEKERLSASFTSLRLEFSRQRSSTSMDRRIASLFSRVDIGAFIQPSFQSAVQPGLSTIDLVTVLHPLHFLPPFVSSSCSKTTTTAAAATAEIQSMAIGSSNTCQRIDKSIQHRSATATLDFDLNSDYIQRPYQQYKSNK